LLDILSHRMSEIEIFRQSQSRSSGWWIAPHHKKPFFGFDYSGASSSAGFSLFRGPVI